jgi:hypothetical protein
MAFINEYIPAADLKKYDFEVLNNRQKEMSGTTPSDSWTIDRDADIWLRKFYTEFDHTAADGGFTGISVWDFFWRGTLMLVKMKTLETGGGIGKHCWARRKLLNINLPTNLENQRAQIIQDLEKTFIAYKDGGVLSEATSFAFALEI